MKKNLFRLIPVLLLPVCDIHAQGEIWSATETKIFKANPASPGSISTVAFFDSYTGYYPEYRLTLAGNGKIYTTTAGSTGRGAIIEYDPATTIVTRVYDFEGGINGQYPLGVTLAANGKLYGVTTAGGANDLGVLFEFDPATNTYTRKFDFATATGSIPNKGITLAANGKLYGMTYRGGANDFGALYEYNPATNTYSKKIDFDGTNGLFPDGYLILGANNKLYGFMSDGGGIIFEYDPSAVTDPYTVKHRFDFDESVSPTFLTQGNNGKLYGGTRGFGVPGFLFEYDYTDDIYTKKHEFGTGSDGDEPWGMAQASDGKFYGVTMHGGSNNRGTLFEYDPVTDTYNVRVNFTAADGALRSHPLYVQTQAITFGALPTKAPGDSAFSVTAIGGASGNPITFKSSNPAVATVSGNTVTIVGIGNTTITASQAGNSAYLSARDVTQTLRVRQTQSITFGAIDAKSFGDPSFTLAATASSGLTVSYSSSNTSVATVSGGILTIKGVGTSTITASQTGNGTFSAATPVSQTLTVGKGNQTITFNSLPEKNFGDDPFTLNATASSSLDVSYTSSNSDVATVSGNMVTIVGAGTTTITASQSGNTNYNAADDVDQVLTINKKNQAITFGALDNKTFGDDPFMLNATASSSLDVSYTSSNSDVATVSGNMVTIVGAGTTTITASQSGNTNYNAADDVDQVFTINKKNQAITFGALDNKTFGDDPFTLSATASSSLDVGYTSSNSNVATVSGNTLTIVGAGTTTITASQSGNTNYNAADDVDQVLTINKKNQSITFGALDTKTFGDDPFTLSAAASSGLAVVYMSLSDKISIDGDIVTLLKAGRVSITASQAGNDTYAAALPVTQSFCVIPEMPSVSPADINSGSPLLTSSASEGNQWFLDGVPIGGATGTAVHPGKPGVYAVQVTIDDCVSELSSGHAFIVTAEENNANRDGIKVYPTLVSDWLTVTFDDLPGKKEASIFTLNGELKESQEVAVKEAKFQVTDYAQGVYFVRITVGHTLKMVRFIKN